jgi:hypothetical protein
LANFALTKDMYDQAKKEHISLSQLLERLDPTTGDSKLTAFERQLKEHNIVTRSIAAKGIYASNVEAFYRTDESKVLFPEFVATTLRESLMADSILPYLIAMTTPIDSNSYRTIYCKNTAANKKAAQKKRVTEAAELPKSKLVTAENSTKIYKYGNQIEASYEVIRRMRLDMLQLQVKRIGQQAGHDEVLEILDVIKDGDGNDNKATIYKSKTDLDSAATAGTLSQTAFLSFLLKFYPYNCNTIVANETGLLQILNLLFPANTVSQMIALLVGGMALPARVKMPQGLFSEFVLLYEPQLETINAHPVVYGLDQRFAIEKLMETGSDIQEAGRFIANQTEVLTISENSGFDKIFPEASIILEID